MVGAERSRGRITLEVKFDDDVVQARIYHALLKADLSLQIHSITAFENLNPLLLRKSFLKLIDRLKVQALRGL